MHLSRFSRVNLVHGPTALESMPRLSEELGGPNLFIKRDDCTGLASGGNKTRKLEFLMADAIDKGADTVITQGAVQSNHVRQTAAAAAKLGLKCVGLLERRVPGTQSIYEETGNVLFDQLFNADLRFFPADEDMNAAMEVVAEEIRSAGGKPYIIPGGGSNTIGALGYVNAALELLGQANDRGLRIDAVVHATGSTGTQGGLVAGLEGANTSIPVIGISVRAAKEAQEENVYKLASATADMLGVRGGIERSSIIADGDYVGPGYGQPTPEMIEAVNLTASCEGVLLDPVYSGKGMSGLIGMVRGGSFGKNDNVVFLHTGGSAALFAYQQLFDGSAG